MTNDSTPTPFEWLSGGLFFGKSNAGGIESVDSTNDVLALLTGVNENLVAITAAAAAAVPPPTTAGAEASTSEAKSGANEGEEASETAKANGAGKKPGEDEVSPSEFLAARLSRVRFLLYDERSKSSQQEFRRSTPAVAGAAMQALTGESLVELMPTLMERMSSLPFESRKHVAAIFNYLLVCGFEGSDAELYVPIMVGFRDYVEGHFDQILTHIMRGHDSSEPSDVGLHCGSMYRSCFKHASLYRQLVSTTERVERYIFPFLDTFVHLPNFDVSSDAMESLRLIFTAGSVPQQSLQSATPNSAHAASQAEMTEIAAQFLTRDYEAIWDHRFNPKLLSDKANYMTRRIALQILSTVLLTRSNYSVMIRYVNSRRNLILIMHQLRDTSPHITLDAFHVFKVFVANPSKIPEVVKILADNKEKLCKYLETLHQDREESDTQFRDEKALIISTIQSL